MRTITPKFKQLMASGNARTYKINVNMTLADNTPLTLTEEDIWSDSFSIETASSGTSSFDLGTAVIGKCKFLINNFDESFSQYDFFNATAVVWVGLEGDLDNNNNQVYYRMGFFTVDEPVYASSLISLELLDNMWKFDVPLSSVTITYPVTIRNALVAICSYCGVSLATQSFHGYDFTLSEAPDKDMNCREFIQYCAMIGCNFCAINDTGALELKWYNVSAIPTDSDILDGGSFSTNTTPYSDGDTADGGTFAFNDGDTYDGGYLNENSDCVWFTRNMSATFGTDVITITGVKFTIEDTAYSIGSAGYVLELENPLVTASNVNSVLNLIWDVLSGFSLRTFNITTASDLSAEIGDCCILKDYKGNKIYSWITLNTFKLANHVVQCNAVSPTRTLEKRYSKTVSAAVDATRKQTESILSDYDLAVQLMNDVAVNAMGGYEDYEDLPTGGRVYYLSNAPITKSGGTCSFQSGSTVFKKTGDGLWVSTNGGQTWGNGYNAQTGQLVVNVLNAIGISAEWIKTGTLTVGGSGVGNPLIAVKDSSNNTVVTLDANGITSYAGMIRSANDNFLINMSTGEVRIAAGTNIYDPNSTYSNTYVPTNSNAPASGWSASEKANHVGETFTNTSTKKTYIYKMTPPTFESAHEYSSNIDEYYEFIVPTSWTTAYVSFDSQCETEGGNYDYLDFYEIVNSSTWKQRIQGSNFKSKDFAIDVSGNHKFYLHWHTDGSVVKWGWKFTVSNTSSQSAISPDWSSESLPSATWTQEDITAGATYEWAESTIEEYIDVKASSEVEIDHDAVFNALTNNGADNGLYMVNGYLYLRGSRIGADKITIGGINYSSNPTLEIKNSSGDVIGSWTLNGIVANAGTFGKLKIFDDNNITYLKYITGSWRHYVDQTWSAGGINNDNRVVRIIVNPYREGWQSDGEIGIDFSMSVRNVSSYKTATQCTIKVYKYSSSSREIVLTAYAKYDGTGTNINTISVYDEETGQWIDRSTLDYSFDHTYGANKGELYYIVCTVEKRNAYYTNNGSTSLSLNDQGNGSSFVVREGSNHQAICSGDFLGTFRGDGEFDTVQIGDYIKCGGGDLVTSTDNMGSYISYDGIRVWTGAVDFGDSNYKMQIFNDEICRDSNGTDYYAQFSTSDERVKEDIEDLDHELSKKLIDGTRTREFTFKGSEGRTYGMIAQEARALLDSIGEEDSKLEYIAGRPDGKVPNQRNIDYQQYIPHIINYVKDLRSEIDELKAEIKTLKGE